jgi:beta-lactamase class D
MFAFLLLFLAILATPTVAADKGLDALPHAFVLIDSDDSDAFRISADACDEKLAPCSTFKIWNTAIGLENGVISDPDAPFWKWDGTKRDIEDWNKDQTLRSAFSVSCVPAYQAMARKIGAERMQDWINRIGYGDRNIAAGIDVFWLPKPPDRKTILISANEQAELIVKLVEGKLPFSATTLMTLQSIMKLQKTDLGTLYGKTGTGYDGPNNLTIGWFVGYVESSGKNHAFACLVKGTSVMGKDARAMTEKLLAARGLL